MVLAPVTLSRAARHAKLAQQTVVSLSDVWVHIRTACLRQPCRPDGMVVANTSLAKRTLRQLSGHCVDESVNRAVESAGQLFRPRVPRVQDALESEAVHQRNDLVDQPVQVDAG